MATTASVSQSNLVINYSEQLPLLLCQFSASGDLQRIQNLLPQLQPQDISRGDYDNRTPLHLAAEEGHLDVVKLLVESGANVNATDRWGETPLGCSLKRGHNNIAKLLKKHGAKESFATSKEFTDHKDPYPL